MESSQNQFFWHMLIDHSNFFRAAQNLMFIFWWQEFDLVLHTFEGGRGGPEILNYEIARMKL